MSKLNLPLADPSKVNKVTLSTMASPPRCMHTCTVPAPSSTIYWLLSNAGAVNFSVGLRILPSEYYSLGRIIILVIATAIVILSPDNLS